MFKSFTLLGFALLCSACAFGDETLSLSPHGDVMRPGLLSEATATTVTVADVVHGREGIDPVGKPDHKEALQATFVGYKKNGYGQNTGNIITDKPVDDIVEAALIEMLELNGHSVGPNGPLRMETNVTDFDLEHKTGFFTIEYIASVEAEIRLIDTATGEEVYAGSFRGNETRATMGAWDDTWTDILNVALGDMVRQISLTPEIKDAFDEAAAADVDVGS